MCLTQLGNKSLVVRKRAGNTIGGLSVVLSDALLTRMVQALLTQIEKTDGMSPTTTAATAAAASAVGGDEVVDTPAMIRTMCTISGVAGHRLGQDLIDRILPIFLKFTDPMEAKSGDDDDDDDDDDNGVADTVDDVTMDSDDEAAFALKNELRESCFIGFESFTLRCPTEVEPHLDNIIQAALAFLSHDPNYSYGDDNDIQGGEGGGAADDNDDAFEDDGEDEFSDQEEDEEDDDDDESWKVRRSAVRALKAVVEATKHDPSKLWTQTYKIRKNRSNIVAKELVGRFKEREENCRVGVIDCFNRLLDVTISAAQANVVSFADSNAMETESTKTITGGAVIDLQTNYTLQVVNACEKLLSGKKGGDRSKSNALTLLATLCRAPGGVGGGNEIASVFQHVQSFLASKDDDAVHGEGTSKALRLDALAVVRAMLVCENHSPVHIQQGLRKSLLPELCKAAQEQWYKVIAEALRSLAAVSKFFVIGWTEADDEATRTKEKNRVANLLFEAFEPKLSSTSVDQEIRECALNGCASLLSNLHANLSLEQKDRLLNLLLERLKSDTSRISGIKTLSVIAASSGGGDDAMDVDGNSKIDLSPILVDAISSMGAFLKLQSRSLKQTSLEALDTVLTNHGSVYAQLANNDLYDTLLQQLSPLIQDSDLHISHLTLYVFC